ncbi:MAG: hypothetical protein DCC71_05095 [Proteobacteria bacterium]|nr:MAG: hypothetical protein DCC71_05095 [Pseudomonadota bacterium]
MRRAVLAAALCGPAAEALTLAAGDIVAVAGGNVLRVDPVTGASEPIASVPFARDVVVDAQHRIFVLSTPFGADIVEVDPDGGATRPIASFAGLVDAKLDVDSAGRLLVATSSALLSIDPDTGMQTSVPLPRSEFWNWLGFVAALPDGRALAVRHRDERSSIQPLFRDFFVVDLLSGDASLLHSYSYFDDEFGRSDSLVLSDVEADPASGAVYESIFWIDGYSGEGRGTLREIADPLFEAGDGILPMAVDLDGDVVFGCRRPPPHPPACPAPVGLVRWDPDARTTTNLPGQLVIEELAVVPVPEPASALLLAIGLGLLRAIRAAPTAFVTALRAWLVRRAARSPAARDAP